MQPKVVVLHWTGSTSALSPGTPLPVPPSAGERRCREQGPSMWPHLVDRDGRVQQLLPENRIARHCIGLNHLSIGIENVGTNSAPLTSAQLQANLDLIEALSERHELTHVIGHFECRAFEGILILLKKNPKYRTVKSDPGTEFMTAVRSGLAKGGLSFEAATGEKMSNFDGSLVHRLWHKALESSCSSE